MKRLFQGWVVASAFSTLGIYFGGRYIELGYVAAAIICFGLLLEHARLGFKPVRIRSLLILDFRWVVLFLCVAILTTLLSPYQPAIFGKSTTSIGGFLATAGASIGLAYRIRNRPTETTAYVRALWASVTVLALVGICQGLFWNLFGSENWLTFNWLNALAGGPTWSRPDAFGPVRRVNGWEKEPAYFAAVLAMVMPIAMLRLGIFGQAPAAALRPIAGRGASIALLIGLFFAMSLLGFAMVALTIGILWFVSRQKNTRYLRLLGVVALGTAVIAAVGGHETRLFDKVASIGLLFGQEERPATSGDSLSTLALLANYTALKANWKHSTSVLGGGLGSHPLAYAYARPASDAPSDIPHLAGLNAEDAGSLGLRLLSETGLLGAAVFLIGAYSLLLRFLLTQRTMRVLGDRDPYKTLSSAFTVAALVILTYQTIRLGSYFYQPLWVLLAFVSGLRPHVTST